MKFPALLLALSLLSLTGSLRADVIVVTCPMPPSCPNLAGIVAGALDGDVVIVRGTAQQTGNVVIDGKGIALIAETGVNWQGTFTIRNVPAGSTVLVSGFNLAATGPVVVENNAGAVRIQDCGIAPLGQVFANPPGMICTNTADLALLRTGLRGEHGTIGPEQMPGSVGLQVSGSFVTLHDCNVTGGSGHPAGGSGATAITLAGGALVMQASRVHGGNGSGTSGGVGGAGGTGLVLNGGAVARMFGGRTLGGIGGTGAGAVPGVHGVPVVVNDGSWSETYAPARTFVAPRIAVAGQPLPLELSAVPGERAVVAGSAGAARVDVPALEGVLLLQAPLRRLGSGFVGPTGVLELALTTPSVPGGAPNGLLHLQPVLADAQGGLHLGCAQVVVHLPVAP